MLANKPKGGAIGVIGGSGFIGRLAVEKLVDRGEEVVVMSRRPSVFPAELQDKIKLAPVDVRLFSDVIRVIHDFGIDKLIHVAYTLTAEGERYPLSAIQINVLGTCNTFEAARISGVKRVVYSSSIAAYGPQDCYGDRLVTEDEILMKPASIYGATKVLTEFLASSFETKFGTEIPVIRIGAVFGAGREERGVTAWTSQLVSSAVRGKSALINIRPNQLATFIYVEDAAEQLVRICLAEKLNYRLYNSGGCTSTPSEFAKIAKKYFPSADIKFNEDAPPWPYPYKLDGTRIAKELNWEIRDPEAGLISQINKELLSLGQRPIERKG